MEAILPEKQFDWFCKGKWKQKCGCFFPNWWRKNWRWV